jgi:hypothetical protein
VKVFYVNYRDISPVSETSDYDRFWETAFGGNPASIWRQFFGAAQELNYDKLISLCTYL